MSIKNRAFSSVLILLFSCQTLPNCLEACKIYSSSSRRLSVPLIKWSVMKLASFTSGSFRENNVLMNEGNKLLFYSLDKIFWGKLQLHCQNKVEGIYTSAPHVTSSCEHLEMFTLGMSQIVLSLGNRFIFLQQNPWEYQCSNCQSLFPEVDSIAERFSLRQSELFPCSGDIC